MKTIRLFPSSVGALVALLTALALPKTADAQTTNWIAFNDHRPSTTPAVNGWAITAPNVTGYDMGAPGDLAASPLTDFRTGNPLVATVAFTRTLAPDDFGAIGRPIATNTPAGRLFYGICDLSNDGIVGVDRLDGDIVTLTFANLDPLKFYIFRGTATRNGGYAARWSVATIMANSWSDAHLNGATGPGVITSNNFPNLGAGQAAYNSGSNPEGAVVGWDFISPAPDGTFTIVQEQYVGPTPGGGQATDANYGYAFGAMMLAEVELSAPAITAHPVASTTVEQNRPFSLSVAATGAPLNFQWYKGDAEIPGATFATYSVGQAQGSDSGMYYAVVYNVLARQTSTVAQVSVFADTTAPTVESIFSYPTVDAGGVATLNQIIIEFNEDVTPDSVSSPASYTLSGGGGNPASIIVTNGRSVVLMLAFPMSEDTDYSVTLSGATDAVGNVAGSSSAPFHSWVAGGGNGLLMESYPVEDPGITPESLFADSDYPNNPDRRDTLRAFDTRFVYPADDTREGYGARIRGVFIPPVSGNWRFFARTRQLGVVYLNPNGTDEAGKIEVLRQSTENAPFNWDRLQSSLISLRAGRAYYIEGAYKGAVGPDYLKVAARLVQDGVPTPVDSLDTDAPDANSLAGAFIAYPLAPRNLGGVLSIAQDVGDVTVEDNHDATFSVVVNNPGGLPVFYQWSREGSGPIAGANGPSYTFQASLDTDNNAMFSVTVSKIGAELVSRTARLTVVPDTSGPEVLEVSSPGFTNIIVRFDERVEAFSAQDAFSYGLTGPGGAIGISSAILEADGRTVTLTPVENLVDAATYTLKVESVTDLALRPIEPNPTFVTFTAGIARPQLAIERYDTQVILSWPVSAAGFVLEQTDALANPSSATVWTSVGVPPTVVGGRNTVTVNANTGAKLFRLRQ